MKDKKSRITPEEVIEAEVSLLETRKAEALQSRKLAQKEAQIDDVKSGQDEEKNSMSSLEEMYVLMRQLSAEIDSVNGSLKLIKKELSRLKGEEKEWLSVDMLTKYIPTHSAKQTIYGWISQGDIPYYKGKKSTLFLKKDIDEWMSIQHFVPDWWSNRDLFLSNAKK